MSETRDIRIKRLYMRSIRRGIKEMDLILQSFADAELAGMNDQELDLYEKFLAENDQDLYPWVSGQLDFPAQYSVLIGRIRDGKHGIVAGLSSG
ncbi:succinate dehydrogenase assembly factor 2 [Aestuariibius sp. HNIBRBA575]|uniref:succinate dehydrogenase assembly factor 2 n=1 Tax=Aestuariibius sp. HNIBRBA575 TaxID=3233343 RepID=UPI0034A16C11